MDDLISRQVVRLIESDSDAYPQEWNDDYEKGFTDALNKVLALPSAQPEIIRCKDCKYRYIENEIWTCPFGLAGGPDFYCGYGAERRTDEQT